MWKSAYFDDIGKITNTIGAENSGPETAVSGACRQILLIQSRPVKLVYIESDCA